MEKRVSQQTMSAIGNLIVEALASAANPEMGWEWKCNNMSFNGVDIGDWTVQVQRINKPNKDQ